MIIRNLIIENFRVFKGRHEVALEPLSRDKPIILLGGLNGAGKTSILTAIRFALYGRLAFSEISNGQEYIDKISSLIHNGDLIDSPNSASVILEFTYNKAGEQSEFTVRRSWAKGNKDKLNLIQNGTELSELNYDQCQGFLNELIPSGIADLFFFDGEKISALAEDHTGRTLQSAFRRLLGLDLIEKLRNDLIIYLKRQASRETEADYKNELSKLESASVKLGKSAENFRYAADLAKISLGLLDNEIKKQEGILAAQGGAFAASKAEEQSKVNYLIKDKALFERTIRQELEGAFPFSLAPKAVEELVRQLEIEAQIKNKNAFKDQILSFMGDLKNSDKFETYQQKLAMVKILSEHLEGYVAGKPSGDINLDISEREFGSLINSVGAETKRAKIRFEETRLKLLKTEEALEQSAANIDRAPDDEQLLGLIQSLRELAGKRQIALNEYHSLLEKAKAALVEQLNYGRRIQRMHDSRRSQHDVSSAVINAERTLDMLDQYARSLTQARVRKLEKNFEDAYARLARKKLIKISAKINPETFDVELLNEQGINIDRSSLSAGEKQIYALSILDALAKSSGRELPVIIDTPLGRLDSNHRDTLVENYLPNASHQTIILSTDTEVHEQYFKENLKPSISHSYRIEFEESSKSSRLVNGYFWEHQEEEGFYAAQ
jgi:DNA sulfur modification protein DndD